MVTLSDFVLCVLIILMKESTEEYCEGGTTEGLAVKYMTEEYTQMC